MPSSPTHAKPIEERPRGRGRGVPTHKLPVSHEPGRDKEQASGRRGARREYEVGTVTVWPNECVRTTH